MNSTTPKALSALVAAATVAMHAASGAIVYTDLMPDVTGTTVYCDLDNLGAAGVTLEVVERNGQESSHVYPHFSGSSGVIGIALMDNAVGGIGNARRLLAGEIMGSATPSTFAPPGDTNLFSEANPQSFDWSVGSRGYLGFKVGLNGKTHYGWAEVSINPLGEDPFGPFNHTLYGYALEDTPLTDIIAGAVPEPSAAMLLLAGAIGTAPMRRRREVASGSQ